MAARGGCEPASKEINSRDYLERSVASRYPRMTEDAKRDVIISAASIARTSGGSGSFLTRRRFRQLLKMSTTVSALGALSNHSPSCVMSVHEEIRSRSSAVMSIERASMTLGAGDPGE
jgi:hypothetical protein